MKANKNKNRIPNPDFHFVFDESTIEQELDIGINQSFLSLFPCISKLSIFFENKLQEEKWSFSEIRARGTHAYYY